MVILSKEIMGEISKEHLVSPERILKAFRVVNVDCKIQKLNWELHTEILYSHNHKVNRKEAVIQ